MGPARPPAVYPDVLSIEGGELPYLPFFMRLGRTWLDRGDEAPDPRRALADYRRVVKLGRLLLQDDVTVIQDLVGLALIGLAAERLYDLAKHQKDATGMIVASLVMNDAAGIGSYTRTRMRNLSRPPVTSRPCESWWPWSRRALFLGHELEAARKLATSSAERRMRLEALSSLRYIASAGGDEISSEARSVLSQVAKSDPDRLVRRLAKWHLERVP